jgi:hypothetical protein
MAFARILYLERLAEASAPADRARVVSLAASESELMVTHGVFNPDALVEVASTRLAWGVDLELPRYLRLDQLQAGIWLAGLGARESPANYLAWLWLARGLATLGAFAEADLSLDHARNLVLHPEEVRMFKLRKRRRNVVERQIP